MAFDFTNNLETAAQANTDFDFTDRAGNSSDTVKSANTSGEWCEENGSTTSNGTGPTANPAGRSGFVYTETSSPSASTTWAMKRKVSRNASTQACTYKLIYNRNFLAASEFYFEYATVASPNETTDWTIFATVVGNETDAWIQGTWDLSAQTTTTLWTRIRFNSSNSWENDAAFSTWNEVGVDRLSREQHSFRFKRDTGGETSTDWEDALNTNITLPKLTNIRPRVLINYDGAATEARTLQVKEDADPDDDDHWVTV